MSVMYFLLWHLGIQGYGDLGNKNLRSFKSSMVLKIFTFLLWRLLSLFLECLETCEFLDIKDCLEGHEFFESHPFSDSDWIGGGDADDESEVDWWFEAFKATAPLSIPFASEMPVETFSQICQWESSQDTFLYCFLAASGALIPNSHPDLSLLQHHPTFSDHTGPQ